MTHGTTAHAQHLRQKEFVHELPEMVFQDQFVAINVGNISTSDRIQQKKSMIASFWERRQLPPKFCLLEMVAKVRALYYPALHDRLPGKHFHKIFNRDTTP